MRLFCVRLALVVLAGMSSVSVADECAKLLVPDFALPSLDTTTDLAYLAVITPENFSAHKTNAFPKLSHVGVLLPIASHLLQYAKSYDEFDKGRAQKYTEHGFDYPQPELAAYYRRLLTAERLNAYDSCSGASGFVARVVRADRDLVQVMASWRAPPGGPTEVAIADSGVSGGRLGGIAPKTLQAQPTAIVFVRNLNADLRWSIRAAGAPADLWVPRFIAPAHAIEADHAACADAGKVVRALYRQTLEREPKPAELAAQSAALKTGRNNVSQLVAQIALGEEYQKRFARGKGLDDVLLGLYKHVFARVPDAKGLNSNKAQFRDATYPTIASAFFENGEYARRFGEWNVPADPPTIGFCSGEK